MRRLRSLSFVTLAVVALAAVVVAAAAAGCGTQLCKPKTMLLTVDYGALGSSVDSIEVQLSYPGDSPSSTTLAHSGGATRGSLEIDFAAGYSAGRTLLVTVNGLSGGVVVATASQSFTLAASCSAETLTLTAGGGADGGVGDDLGDGGGSSPADSAGPPPDLTGLVFPSNVSVSYLNASTADWTVTMQTVINTDGTDVASAITPAPAAGVLYAVDGLFAVVAVHKLTVAANISLSAKGSRPLIIVAGDTIVVNGLIDGGAHLAVAGPGGAPTMGMGHGGPGESVTANTAVLVSGGGGAGYSSVGGVGGDVGGGGIGGTAGTTYGTATLMPVISGSAGGVGGKFSCATTPAGGAGGGYLQLSARTSITVAPFSVLGSIPSGGISVGGGGGGSCTASDTAGGAGGGSGGSLLLESPTIACSGLIGATGGGGGSGSSPGSDGLQISNPTASSIGGAPTTGKNNGGGSGCNGVTATTTAQIGGAGVAGTNMASPVGAGGGGGGFGRIYVRASGTPMIMQSTPAATIDSTLPSMIP